mmetsp:Transcript_54110/g.127126  ORF Transcript_54110/g.127126 Transcript_54110/m.127126 type:complete len:209 (+) Transcript_54110:954-1580(+)
MTTSSIKAQKRDFNVSAIEAIKVRKACTKRKTLINRTTLTMRVIRTIRKALNPVMLLTSPMPSSCTARRMSVTTSQREVMTTKMSRKLQAQSSEQKKCLPSAMMRIASSVVNHQAYRYCKTTKGSGRPLGASLLISTSTPRNRELVTTASAQIMSKHGRFTNFDTRLAKNDLSTTPLPPLLSEDFCAENFARELRASAALAMSHSAVS